MMPLRDGQTDAERKLALDRMAEICHSFYLAAVATDVHAFIEFTGLLGEFLNLCKDAEESGNTTWMRANVHGGENLPMRPYRLGYLREKLTCIYGEALFQTEDDTPENDPTREVERSLSALALAVYHEPEAVPMVLHAIGHMVPLYQEELGDERLKSWLAVQNRRAADAYVRTAEVCEHAETTEEEKRRLFTEAMAKIESTGNATIFGKFLRAMAKTKPSDPPPS